MKCPKCDAECKSHGGTSITLVGYDGHDDNCMNRRYGCTCGQRWTESLRRTCPDCGWKGKETCFCHTGPKVDQWSDPPFAPEDWFDKWMDCPLKQEGT
jgi:hypothetical protein